ncbi:MAG: DUF1003 domain-containing protein, partial [Myxococcales bacterium]|nr:DUF1003 domain-containing protein [Myxococcales bacterium]
ADAVRARHPGLADDARLCRACLAAERTHHVVGELQRERGDLDEVERDVSRRAADHVAIATRLNEEFDRSLTLGERVADGVARVGGSWGFIGGFVAVLVTWTVVNAMVLRGHAFDPYPFILLNLVLSCLAAIQAPIIMMSQRRLGARDRLQADQDFRTNLKAELEIALLHEKLDHLLHVQWERMVELQQVQLEILEELATHEPRR